MARLLRRQAADELGRLAIRLDELGNPSAAGCLRTLAEAEAARAAATGEDGAAVPPGLPEQVRRLERRLREGDAEPDDPGSLSPLMTPYDVMAMAVRRAQRGFALLTYLAAGARNAGARQRAEALAQEELSRAAALRRQRREAYHARPEAAVLPEDEVPGTASPAEFRRVAARLERDAAATHARLAEALAGAGHHPAAELLRDLAAEEMAGAKHLGDEHLSVEREAGARTEEAGREGGQEAALQRVAEALHPIERAARAYLAVADRTADQEVLAEAQELAATAVRRLSLVQGRLAELGAAMKPPAAP